MSSLLFVGNLSIVTTENDLREAFGAFGKVHDATLMMDRATGRPRGFGFVWIKAPKCANRTWPLERRSGCHVSLCKGSNSAGFLLSFGGPLRRT
jgi:hypothetical protein